METALRLVVTNAAAAAVLAAVALVASRLVRRPAVAHALWLVALVKLVTPPLVPLPLLPSWDRLPALVSPASPLVVRIAPAATALDGNASAETPRSAGAGAGASARRTAVHGAVPGPGRAAAVHPEPPGERPAPRLGPLAALVLTAGALSVAALAAWRFVRFRRMLAWAEPAATATVARAAQLAAELGLRRVPPVLVVPARIPPMLWPEPGGPRLLLPRDLLPELGAAELDALLAHELAHVHRRDHWVRLVELAATALFWWYPLTWWARRALRRAEERCCDEWVLRVLPRSAEAYANGLLKSLTFVSSAPASVPALASGASPLYELELRLKEILMSRPAPRLATPLRLALFAAAATSLAVFPTHAREEEAQAAAATAPAKPTQPAVPAPARAKAPARTAIPSLAAATAAAARTPAPAPVVAPARVAQAATPVAAPAPAQAPATPQASRGPDEARAAAAIDAQRRELDARRRSLQHQELELSRMELELNAKAEQAELKAAADEMRAQGNTGRAELYEKQLAMTGRRTLLERRRLELDSERLGVETKLEARERAQQDALATLEGEGSEAARRKAELEMERAEAERHKIEEELEKKQSAMEAEAETLEKEAQKLATEEQIHAVSEATEEMARSLAEQADTLKAAMAETGARPDIEREIKRLEAALAALKAGAPAPRP